MVVHIIGIRTIIKELKQNGEQLPAPSKLEDIIAYSDYADATAYLVVSVRFAAMVVTRNPSASPAIVNINPNFTA
jgi:hypothetical protein